MNYMKKLIDIDNVLISAEAVAEKGRFLSGELYQRLSDPHDDACKLYEWDGVVMRSDIVLDYAIIIEEKLAELRHTFDELFEQMKEAKDK